MRTQDAIALVGRRLLNHSGTPGGLFYIYIRSFSFYPRSLLTLVRTSLMNPQTRQQMLGGGGGGQGARHMWLVGGAGRKCTRWLPTCCLPRGCGMKLRNVMQVPCNPLSAPHLVTPTPPHQTLATSPLSDTAVSLSACSTLHLNIFKCILDLHNP
jgi:hypothetical protein